MHGLVIRIAYVCDGLMNLQIWSMVEYSIEKKLLFDFKLH